MKKMVIKRKFNVEVFVGNESTKKTIEASYFKVYGESIIFSGIFDGEPQYKHRDIAHYPVRTTVVNEEE